MGSPTHKTVSDTDHGNAGTILYGVCPGHPKDK